MSEIGKNTTRRPTCSAGGVMLHVIAAGSLNSRTVGFLRAMCVVPAFRFYVVRSWTMPAPGTGGERVELAYVFLVGMRDIRLQVVEQHAGSTVGVDQAPMALLAPRGSARPAALRGRGLPSPVVRLLRGTIPAPLPCWSADAWRSAR